MNTKLYVGNLSFTTTENDLQDLFQTCGGVSSVNLIMDRVTGNSKGFAFVTMTDGAGFTAAQALNGKDMDGRTITVSEARPREERSGGGSSGFGGDRKKSYGGSSRREFSR